MKYRADKARAYRVLVSSSCGRDDPSPDECFVPLPEFLVEVEDTDAISLDELDTLLSRGSLDVAAGPGVLFRYQLVPAEVTP